MQVINYRRYKSGSEQGTHLPVLGHSLIVCCVQTLHDVLHFTVVHLLRPREVKPLVEGHTARKWGLNTRSHPASSAVLFQTVPKYSCSLRPNVRRHGMVSRAKKRAWPLSEPAETSESTGGVALKMSPD